MFTRAESEDFWLRDYLLLKDSATWSWLMMLMMMIVMTTTAMIANNKSNSLHTFSLCNTNRTIRNFRIHLPELTVPCIQSSRLQSEGLGATRPFQYSQVPYLIFPYSRRRCAIVR
jgi:hypothetical protein